MTDDSPIAHGEENTFRPGPWIGVFLLMGYLAVSWSFGDLYPFTTVPMYKGTSDFPAQRLVVVDGDGRVRSPDLLTSITCESEFDEGLIRCPESVIPASLPQDGHAFHIPYLDWELVNHLNGLPEVKGEGASLWVVRRTWHTTTQEGELGTLDCVVAKCRGDMN